MSNPVLLLADEPSANLDSTTTRELLELLKRLNLEQGMTIVTATHDPMVMDYTRRRVQLVDGSDRAGQRCRNSLAQHSFWRWRQHLPRRWKRTSALSFSVQQARCHPMMCSGSGRVRPHTMQHSTSDPCSGTTSARYN